jgi:calmodulin
MATVSMKSGETVPEEFIETFRDNFNLIDDDKDGFINKDASGALFRGLGQTPTDSEMKDLLDSLPDQVSFETFISWFSNSYRDPHSESAVARAFRVFDLSNSGVLPISKFRELLSSLGDSMTPDEIEDIIREIPVDSRGNFDYVVLARKLVEGPKGCPHLISRD